jgi:N-methylhydantoinase A
VTVTASVWGTAPELRPRVAGASARRGTQRIFHGGRELEATLLIGAPGPGEQLEGPSICALGEATLLIAPGWRGRVLADGTIELTRP